MSQPILKAAAGVAALAAIAFGASAIAGASGNSQSSARGPMGAVGAAPRAGGPPAGGPPAGGPPAGAPRRGVGPGMGQPVTGATAAKVKAAALARYPGTIERIDSIPGLGYVAHVFRAGNGGEVHVLVTSQFQVKGLAPGPGGGRPPSGSAPSGTVPGGSSS
jgi:hypothetical protein